MSVIEKLFVAVALLCNDRLNGRGSVGARGGRGSKKQSGVKEGA